MKKNIQTLERIQRRASKKVKGMKHLSSEERLQRLNLMNIEDRAKRGDLIETYKIMTGKLNLDSPVQLICWGSQSLPLYMATKSRKEKCRSEEPNQRHARH